MSMTINVFVDGGCRGNPGLGAWAFAVYLAKNYQGSKYGTEEMTTNNQMELQGLLEALEWVTRLKNPNNSIRIHCDSKYSVDGYNSWLNNWERRGWKTASGTEVKNLDQWKKVAKVKKKLQNLDIKVQHVKGHSGNPGNEKADQLCNEAMDKEQDNA